MARLKTHYDNLQIARNASPEVVRAAYRGLSQKWHPDRNPPERRPECERVMKIINAAYEVLSDPAERARHDRWIAEQERLEQRPPSAAGEVAETVGFDFADSRLQPGTIRWSEARDAARAEINLAFSNRHPGYASAPIARLSSQVYISLSGSLMYAAVWGWSQRVALAGQAALVAYLCVLLACLAIVYGLLRSYQILASGCGRRVAVTPTHLVECDYATMTVWPLLGARRFDAADRNLNGSYSGTEVRFEHLAGGSRSFVLRSRPAAERLKLTLADNVLRARQAGIGHLGEIKNSALYWQPKGTLHYAHNGAPAIGVATLVGALLLSLTVFFATILPPAPERRVAAHRDGGRQPAAETADAPAAAIDGTALVQPATGWVQRPERSPAVPMTISAPPPGDYFVKLTDTAGVTVGTLFLRGGETLRVYVPVGLYRIRYAYGGIWQGPEQLFGADTAYAELRDTYSLIDPGQAAGHDIALYGRLASDSLERSLSAAQW